jgi:hypothetical protein
VSYNLENMVIFCLRVCISIQKTNQNLKAKVTILKPVNIYIYITTQNVETMALAFSLTYTILKKMLHTWYHQYNTNLAIYLEMYILTSTS